MHGRGVVLAPALLFLLFILADTSRLTASPGKAARSQEESGMASDQQGKALDKQGKALDQQERAFDQFGQTHAWRGQLGQLTVIDFAASWCGPCRHSLPKLQAYAEGRPDLRVLVVSVDQEVSGRDRLVEALGLRLPVLWDSGHAIARHYRPEAMPTSLVLDPQGAELLRVAGSGQEAWSRLTAFLDRQQAGR